MPQLAPLSLSGTSATYTFSPGTATGGRATWINRASGVPAFSPRLEVSVTEPKSATGAHRVIGQLQIPRVETVDGVARVTRITRVNFDANFAQTSTGAERLDDLAIVKSLFSNSAFKEMVENVEPAY